MARVLLNDNLTHAVTGEVKVLNSKENFLTRLVDIRYHIAFQNERASQSMFGNVTCVSGPLGCYSREAIDLIKDDFINQQFLGKECTYGDDRHLTNLVLKNGFKVRYANESIAYTQAPNKIYDLIVQQTRWSKSYWREIIFQVSAFKSQGIYLVYDWIITMLLPFILVGTVVLHLTPFDSGAIYSFYGLLIMIITMSLIRVVEPIVRTKNPVYMIFIFYAFIYFSIMLPMKFYFLATLNNTSWGTR